MTNRETMQQALEALDIADNIALVGAAYTPKSIDAGLRKIRDSATALREALEREHAMHELAEPVAYYHPRNGFYWAKPTSIFAPTVVDVEPLPLYAAAERNK